MDMGQHQEEFLVSLLVALGAGIAFGRGGPELPFLPLLALLAGLLAWAAWGIHRASRQVWPAFWLAAFLLGLLRFQSSMLLLPDDISHFAGQELRVAGRLTETPQARERSDGSVSVRYCLRAEKIRQGKEEERSASGNLYVYVRLPREEAAALPQIGDTLLVRGSLRLPHGFHNPGQIDTEMLLRSQGITATLVAAKGGLTAEALPEKEVLAWTGLLRRLAAVREHYLSSMQAVMPKEDAAAIFAMLFGGYQGLKPELLEFFATVGANTREAGL